MLRSEEGGGAGLGEGEGWDIRGVLGGADGALFR